MTAHIYIGKVDIKSLLSFSKADIHFNTLIRNIAAEELSEEHIINLLRQAALCTTGLTHWDTDVKLSELGASSFDIVRLTNHFMSTVAVPNPDDAGLVLVELLLSNSLEQVATQLCSKLKRYAIKELPLDTDQLTRKRLTSSKEVSSSKHSKVESPLLYKAHDTHLDTLYWRGGKMFRNGV